MDCARTPLFKSDTPRYTTSSRLGAGRNARSCRPIPRGSRDGLDSDGWFDYEPILLERHNLKGTSESGRSPRPSRQELSRALLRAGKCGKPALPALLGRGVNLAGPSGYWVGHSSGCFAVGLLSVREPSRAARLPRIYAGVHGATAGRERGTTRVQRPTPLIGFRPFQTDRSALRVVAPWALFPCLRFALAPNQRAT